MKRYQVTYAVGPKHEKATKSRIIRTKNKDTAKAWWRKQNGVFGNGRLVEIEEVADDG